MKLIELCRVEVRTGGQRNLHVGDVVLAVGDSGEVWIGRLDPGAEPTIAAFNSAASSLCISPKEADMIEKALAKRRELGGAEA